MTHLEALDKLQRYCAYQERCHREVRSKLLSLKVFGDDLERVIASLIEDDYLNEERFARAFARGKHRIKNWGRVRITQELKSRGISSYCIRKAMEEIDDGELYDSKLDTIIRKYLAIRMNKWPPRQLKQKTIQHAMSKGYEYALVQKAVEQLLDLRD